MYKKREDLIASPMLYPASPNAFTHSESKNKCPLCTGLYAFLLGHLRQTACRVQTIRQPDAFALDETEERRFFFLVGYLRYLAISV